MKEKRLRRTHTREFKLECVRQVATGQKRPAQVCREHSLSESVLLCWRREYEARGEEAFTDKQLTESEALERKLAELERFCGKLALENEILKKGLARYHSTRDMPRSTRLSRSILGCRSRSCASCLG
jgi:transposase